MIRDGYVRAEIAEIKHVLHEAQYFRISDGKGIDNRYFNFFKKDRGSYIENLVGSSEELGP